jgi:hypothetical protein
MNPVDNPEAYNSILLAGERSPGFVVLSGHERVQKWDVKESKKNSGASTTHQGEAVGTFTATFTLVRDAISGIDEITEWESYQTLIESTVKGSEKKALTVYHPDLARNGFTSVVLGKMGGMTHDKGGGATIAVLFQEYFPPKANKGTGTPSGSKSKSGKDGAEDPNDPLVKARKELENVINEGKKAP